MSKENIRARQLQLIFALEVLTTVALLTFLGVMVDQIELFRSY
jgi:hypothetical protein